jgi:hypothetical protein
VLSKINGFTDEQILEIRQGRASFDARLDALARFVKSAAEQYGHPDPQALENLFAVGYTPANLVDIILVIADKSLPTISTRCLTSGLTSQRPPPCTCKLPDRNALSGERTETVSHR